MLSKEAFLKRTAFRFRQKTAYSRGLNEREQALAEFVYDQLCEEISTTLQQGLNEFWLTPLACEEDADAVVGDPGFIH